MCVWTLQVYHPRIRAYSVALRPVSQCQAEQRRQLAQAAGTFRLPPERLGFRCQRHSLVVVFFVVLSRQVFPPLPGRRASACGEPATDPGGQHHAHRPLPEEAGDRRPGAVRLYGPAR